MSAFVVDKVHIDLLVTAAGCVIPSEHRSGLSWYFEPRDNRAPVDQFPNLERRELPYMDADESHAVGQMLWGENLLSIEFRYPDTLDGGNWPGPCSFEGWTSVQAYTFERVPGTVAPWVVLDALSCYDYQSCEHPGWRTSEAKAFCEALTHKMLSMLRRNSGTWDIDHRDVFRKAAS